ncbi:PAS domain-containing sensor histidine kinase [Flavobacterium sp. 245]|uniref:PAS domain-containing sensor histidine kinase n=1 Tax=Flavobacterium sp. 245 TaxID=2512115 RepID=UPI00105C9D5E|nr:PAS domain-containing sensor histidine kinase [Flavobacterium sp. 245]TDP00269.1 PAS domain S-box-containing protein [Flavobacterium sp. 245]
MNVENTQELYLLVMNAPVGICVLDAQTLVAEIVNDSFIEVAGKPREAILGKFYWDTFAEVSPYYQSVLETVISKGKPYSINEAELSLIRHGKAETVYVTFVYAPLKDNTGEVKKVAVWVMDNTLQVLQRHKVEESEKFARTVFYNSPVAKLVYTGPEMVLVQANEKMLEIFGKGDSIIGKPIMEAVPEMQQTHLFAAYQHVLTTGEIHSQKAARIMFVKNGSPYYGYYDYTYKPLHDPKGRIHGVICTAIDVTQQVKANKSLEEAEQNMRGAVELAQLGTWTIDVATNGLTYSDRLIEWFGYDPSAQNYSEVIPILLEEDRQRVADAVAWGLNPESGGLYDEIYTVIHPITGKKRILHAQGKTVFDPEGKPVRMNGTAQDITIQIELQTQLENQVQQRTEETAAVIEELRATNEELEQTNVQLIHSNEELEEFAYIASHDLQEPLRKISTFVQLLEGKIREHLDEKSAGYVDKIKDATSRMSKLIRDVLAYSAVPKDDRALVAVNLEHTAKNALEDYDLVMERTGAKVTWNTLPVIQGIPLQMSQLFFNLIGNALKFRRPDVPPRINIHCSIASPEEIRSAHLKEAMSYYKIQFTDNGIGMKPEDTQKIFSIFKRLHGKNEFAGTGIGLAMCKKIVQNHNGEIDASESSENGAVFKVYLPAKN